MIVWCILLFANSVSSYQGATPGGFEFIHDMSDVAAFGDGPHRGEKWEAESLSTESSTEIQSELESHSLSSSSSVAESSSLEDTSTSEASSAETKEHKRATEVYRTCTPCPHDMLKKYSNTGIKWICAAYQRARRSFKSECMMRYRNCQDGTMFVKIHDHRCRHDNYHGRDWFYIYKI